jgi:hypothetical protein
MGPAESPTDRLNRLAERRRQAAQRPHSPATSSDGEAGAEAVAVAELEAGQLPQRSAVHALRQLLQQRGSVFDSAGVEPLDARRESSSGAATVGPPQPFTAPAVPELADASAEAAAPATGGSMPPTARLLISLSNGIGQEEVQAERQLRTAELRDADTEVRNAEVGCCCTVLCCAVLCCAVLCCAVPGAHCSER